MARTQLRTKDYPDAARKRLGEEVERARRAAGFRYRTDFCRAHSIKNLRGLEMLEGGRPGVGQAFLFEVARALPGWTEDTPRLVLEGGDPPTASEEEAKPLDPLDRKLGGGGDEKELVLLLIDRGFSNEEIAEAIDRRRRRDRKLPTVEDAERARGETNRERNAITLDQESDTGT